MDNQNKEDSNKEQYQEEEEQEDDRDIFGIKNKIELLRSWKDLILTIPNLPINDNQVVVENNGKKIQGVGAKFLQLAQQRENIHTQSSEGTGVYAQSQREFGKTKKYFNVFGVQRGRCRICDDGCSQYRACFNIEAFRGVEIFQCLNCGCSMNSHYIIRNELTFSNMICEQVNRRYINQTHLNLNCGVAIFFMDRLSALEFKVDVESLVSYLNEGGFSVLSFYELDIATLQRLWLEKYLHSRHSKHKDFLRYQQYIDTFLQIVYMYGIENTLNLTDSIKQEEHTKILEYYLERLKKVNSKLKSAYQNDQIAIAFLLTSNRPQTLHNDFKKFMFAAKQELPQDLLFFYSSKNKVKALRDAMFFFPKFFKLNITSFLISQQNDAFYQDRKKVNDAFMDMLDFNNIAIVRSDFSGYGPRHLSDAFSFIPNPDKFLKLVSCDGIGTILKVCSKVGPSNLTIMSNTLPNYYRISDEGQNQQLCDALCPELFVNQRILIIYRPILVKSNLNQLFREIWRINNFTPINSTQIKFTFSQARMLAELEEIHPDNVNNYVTMMTEGYSDIVLYAKPGAFEHAKIIAEGCLTGLKVRQSKRLQELTINHKSKSGEVFQEKLPMQFHNYFESFTKSNIFLSIKELFDLEELVLQENQINYNTNLFVNDEQVFLAPLQDTKSKLTHQLRQQIIKDLPKENFNFYLFHSKDEISTEQLISLFLPQCSQNEMVYLLIKPTIEKFNKNYLKQIVNLIKRMKFVIFDQKSITLHPSQVNDMINYLTPFKLQKYDDLINFYSNKELTILMIMKPAGTQEMRNFLVNSNLYIPKYGEPNLIEDLIPFLIPFFNVHAIRFIQNLFNPNLQKFDAISFIKLTSSIPYLIKYMLAYAMGAEMLGSEYEQLEQESTKEHLHYKVQSKEYGLYEIRVRATQSQQSKYLTQYDQALREYQLQSWYYAKVNRYFPQRCPLSYQYRLLHQERFVVGEIDQIFDCQEYVGRNFLLELYRQIYEFGHGLYETLKIKKLEYIDNKSEKLDFVKKEDIRKFDDQMNKVIASTDKRGKMLSYFWGVKLAKFVNELELITCEEFPNGYGEIQYKNTGYECKYKRTTIEYEHISEIERKKYKDIKNNIIAYIKEQVESDPLYFGDGSQLQESQFQKSIYDFRDSKTQYERVIIQIYNAIFPNEQPIELFKYALDKVKLLPHSLQLSQLRIQNDRAQIKFKQHLTENTFFDWTHEQQQANNNLTGKQPYCNYVIAHSLPEVKSQFTLVADVLYLLLVELKTFNFYKTYLDSSVFENDPIMNQDNTTNFTPKSQAMIGSMKFIHLKSFQQWFIENQEKGKSIEEKINQLIKGFESTYFLEQDVVLAIQQIHKQYYLKQKKQMPDLIRMFLFLKCFQELDRYINLSKQCRERQAELARPTEQQLVRFYNEKNIGYDQAKDIDDLRFQEIEKLKEEKSYYNGLIKKLLYFIQREFQKKFYFDSEQTELKFNQAKLKESKFNIEIFAQYMQNNLDDPDRDDVIEEQLTQYFETKGIMAQQKEFIESKRYFQPLEMGNNEDGKLNQEQIDDHLIQQHHQRTEKVMGWMQDKDRKGHLLEDVEKDDIQKRWIEQGVKDTAAGKYVDTRPDNKKTGIYVDTVKTIGNKLDEKIDKVIRKFMQDKMNNFNKQ